MSAIICYRNFIDDPDVTLSLNTGAPLAGFPLDNLRARQLARSTRLELDDGAPFPMPPSIVIDLGAQRSVDLIALIGINSTKIGEGAVGVEYSANGIEWDFATATCPSDFGAPDLPRSVLVRGRPSSGGSRLTTRFLRIQPNWGTADAYREIGRLYIADSIELTQGCEENWTLGSRDYGVLDRSAGLQYYADRRTRGRVLTMPMSLLDTTTAFGFGDGAVSASNVPSLDDLINFAGTTGDVIVAPRADNPLWLRRTGVYGHLTDDSLRIEHQAGPNFACILTVEEER